jgi:tetratricopeptide (TPR) repeat protein
MSEPSRRSRRPSSTPRSQPTRSKESGGRGSSSRQDRQQGRERARDPRRKDSGRAEERGRRRSGAGSEPTEPGREPLHLSDEIARELHATARPGKGGIAVKVFGQAAGAFDAGDYDEAIRLGEQAKHIALRAPTVRELLGLAYYRGGRYAQAARELSAFRRISGSAEQNPVLADCYRALARPARAVELCDEVDARSVAVATLFESHIVAAGALAEMGRLDEAIRRLEALELDPETAEEHHLRAWYALADLLERRGRFTQARRLFEAVAGADPEATDAPLRVRRLSRKAT